ncbi:O-antigen polysaccharide polymerase Wzy [Trichlorobacter ammonificans]|uniref:Oligosaccharide repeat unit polymerase n=1 Tax=Trichlorobacter ammonificans TaxID=2916410 RepID=A0ABN8HHN4_9BACT|nr:O-antigen polysaccharide polymerase Wzy [Trichlorobacter ammonificans]CAH2032346.1 membrane protein of unknown function [Trichlorobacter ammonificans]
MLFNFVLIVFIVLVIVTVFVEFRRMRRITLCSMLSFGNVLYNALTPALCFYEPQVVWAFELYVNDAGLEINELGLVRSMLAACVFQLGILIVACLGKKKNIEKSISSNSKHIYRAATVVGMFLLLLGVAGVMWIGLKYNGQLMGLYKITYFERSALALNNPAQAFLMNLGIYGAAQLIVVFLLTDRPKWAVSVLLMMTLHAVGMKSKFPVFWVLLVFSGVVVFEKKSIIRMLVPIGFTALILSSMSFLRGVQNISELPLYIATYWEEIGEVVSNPWGNDIPGPSAMTYYVLNTQPDFTIAPIWDTIKIMIPSSLVDRGMLLPEIYAEKMIGSGYAKGLGFGWPLICDGFLLFGWIGIGLFSGIVSLLARFVETGHSRMTETSKILLKIICFSLTPFALYSIRESMGGLIKALVVMSVLVWLPTWLFANRLPLIMRRITNNAELK